MKKKAIREIEKADRKWYELEIYILNMPFDKFLMCMKTLLIET